MKGTLLGLVLLACAGAGSLMAQNSNWWNGQGHGWRQANHGHHDQSRTYRDRDIRQDEREIARDRWEIRQDMRRGDYRAAQREREEMRARERDLHRDRRADWARYSGWAWH